MSLHFSSELHTRPSNSIFYQPQSLLFNDGTPMIQALKDKIGNFLDDANVRGPQEIANFLQLVNRRHLLLVGRRRVDHPRSPVRLHRPPARLHLSKFNDESGPTPVPIRLRQREKGRERDR
uniref:Uncharacterized protein MANES_11G036200 n=1 Tax=Rhizophora mucronata TaxID=61149 RepID=A0A2P2P309_RHIMU